MAFFRLSYRAQAQKFVFILPSSPFLAAFLRPMRQQHFVLEDASCRRIASVHRMGRFSSQQWQSSLTGIFYVGRGSQADPAPIIYNQSLSRQLKVILDALSEIYDINNAVFGNFEPRFFGKFIKEGKRGSMR